MKINYNFAGINIGINSDISYKESEPFYDFISSKTNKNDIDIDLICSNSQMINTKGNMVFEEIFKKIYKINGVVYREFYCVGDKKPASCFIEQEYNKRYKCYLYNNKKKDYNTFNIFSMVGFEYLLNLKSAIILHSSQILYNGKSILFSAPSQTGKSTQADLWVKYENSELINGDRSAIRKVDGVWTSYGLPYAGSSDIYKNIASPIAAIVILRQGKKNEIRKATKIEAFKYLYSETTVNLWDEEFINRTSNIIEGLINEVPVYMYYCLPDKSAVDKLKGVLEEEVYGTTTNNEVFI